MSENVEIQIDLKLNEEQARVEMNTILSSMKELANSKANNINIKVNVDKNGLADLAKVETAVKEINKLSADAQKALFRTTSSSSSGMDKTLVARRQQISAFTKDLQKAEAQLAKLGKSGFVDQSQVARLQQTLTSLKGIKLDNLKNMGDSSFKSAQAGAEQLLNSVKELNNVRLDGLKNANIGNFTTKISADLDKIEAKFKQLGKSTTGIDQIRSQLASLNAVAPDRLPSTFANIRNQVRGLSGELRQVNSQAQQGSRFFGDLGATLRTFTLGNIIGDGVVRAIRDVTTAFLEMDKAMTDVIKVADSRDIDSTLKLDNIREQANGIAKEVGMASYDVLYGISDAIQQGMGNLEESIAVARASLMLANVGDMSQGDASSAISTMVKGFQLQPLQEVTRTVGDATNEMSQMKVVTNELAVSMDALNFAGNNYAIGTDGVAEAMKRGGAVLHNYGVSLEDTTALITATNESIQNPEKVGNGLKSIAINLAGMKTDAKDGSLQLNKTALALKEIAGIDVYSDKKNGKVKNMVEILDEVKGKWNDLREDEQLALSDSIAGKHQAVIFQSLMSNYENFEKLRGEFERGEHLGSAEEENARYVDSIAGKLNELKQIWLSIGQTIVTSDFTKGMLDGLIKVSEVIEKVVKNTKGLNIALLAIGIAISRTMKAIKLTTSATSGASGMNFMNGLGFGKNGEAISRVLGKVKTDITSATTAGQKFKTVFTSAFSGMKTELAGVGTKIAGVGKMFAGMALQTVAIMAITLAIQKMAEAWDNYKNGLKNSEKDIRNSLESAESSLKESQDNSRYLEGKQKQYEELIKKKKEYSSIPFEDQTPEQIADMDELKNITSELAEMFPQLVIGYDDDGLPMMIEDMDTLKEKMQEVIDSKNELVRFEREKLADNLWEQWNVGEKDGTTKKDEFNNKQREYDNYLKLAQNFKDKFQKSLSEGEIKGNWFFPGAEEHLKNFKDYQSQAKDMYTQLKTDREQYLQDELEVQRGYTSKIFGSDSFKQMEETGKNAVKSMYDSVDWIKLSEPMRQSMQLSIDKFAEFAQTDGGEEKLQKWSKEIENANKVFQQTNDIDSYNKKIAEISKTISDATGIDASLLVEGFTNLPPILEESQMALQNFLSGYNKTLEDVRNKDSIAINLRDQFLAVDSALSEIMNDLDVSIQKHSDGEIELNLDIATNIANKSDMPQQISQLINDLKADGSLKGEDSQLILSVLAKFRDGDLEGLNQEIESFLGAGGEKYKFEIGTQFDEKSLATLEERLNTLRIGDTKDNTEKYQLVFEMMGDDKAQMYQDIIDKVKANGDITNKLILENASDIDSLNSYEEFINWAKENPEILQKYGLEVNGEDGAEKIEKIKDDIKNIPEEKTSKVKAEASGKEDIEDIGDSVDKVTTTIDTANSNKLEIKTGKENVLETIADVEKLIKISSKVEDGKYKLEIDSNTENAVRSLRDLEDALAGLSDKMKGLATSATIEISTASAITNITVLQGFIDGVKTALSSIKSKNVNINTAQSAKNLSGLITRVEQYTTAIDGVVDRDANINTEQSAKNLSGLIAKIKEYNDTKIKNIKISTNASSVAMQINSITTALRNMPSSKTITVRQQTVGAGAMGIKGFSAQSFSAPQSFGVTPVTFSASSMPQNAPQPSEMLARSIVPKSLMTQASSSLSRTATFANQATTLNNNFLSNLSRATLNTPIAKGGADIERALKYGIDLLTELDYRIKMVTNSISQLDKKMKHASNQEKLKYLEEQKKLYFEQNALLKEREDILVRQRNNYKHQLEQKGFNFNNDGNMTNYEEKLLVLEKQLEDKDKALKKANEGKNESAKKKAQQAYDSAKENLDHIKKLTEEYIKINTSELPKVAEEWIDIGNSIADANDEQRKIKDALKQIAIDSFYISLNKQVDQYKNSLSEIDVLLKNAHGSQKKLLLEQQKDILGKQDNQLKRVLGEYVKEMNSVREDLASYGFEFRANGDIINYIGHMTKLKETMSDSDFEYMSSKAEKYLDILINKIPSLDKELLELSNTMFDVQWALKEVNREIELFGTTIRLKELEIQFDKLADAIALIDVQMKHAYGKDKLKLIKDKIELLKEQNTLQEKNIDSYQNMLSTYQKDLGEFGFKFNSDGDITNLNDIYSKYQNNENFSKVKELVEEYLDIQRGKLPDAVKEWENLSSAIKDAYKEQLEITKEAEDKITEIYKKQLEERKKLIEKELKAKVDAINKEKEAYNKAREEAKYKDNYEDQLAKVEELQKKYEIAKKDTSLSGQKKLQDIMKELNEEQKKLQDLIQDKIDSDINSMFDEEQKKLEENAEKQKDLLDEEFSDKKIQELVKQALSTGVFEDIDGTMRSLQDVMLDFLDEYGDGMGATGELIKSEWITNLEIAKDTMKDIADISKEIISGGNIGVSRSGLNSSLSDVINSSISGIADGLSRMGDIIFKQPLVNIEGNVDKDIFPQVQKEIKELENKIPQLIIDAIR